MTLGEKIQDLRRRNAMSQDVLAEKLEVSRQAVSKWERDEAMPETDKIVRIAQLFAVSTDYLLMQAPEPPKQQPTQSVPQTHAKPTLGGRLERFIRRHGYKGGYALIVVGAFLCLIALMGMILVPKIGSGMFDIVDDFGSAWDSGLSMEGDLPQDVLDAIYGQAGSGMNLGGSYGDDLYQQYQSSVDQMMNAWQNGVRIMTAMFGVPVLLVGGGLITLGTVVVVKGKKIAAEINN